MSHLITCPECKKHLQVPDELIGKKVQCPECKHTFTAQPEVETVSVTSKSSAPAPTPSAPAPPPPPPKKKAAWDSKDDDEVEKGDDNSYDVRKRKRGSNDDDEDDDDRDRDDDDDRPRRKKRRRAYANHYMPHRGGMILAFGIIGLVSGLGFIFGPIAWIMGNNDMRDIQAGRMDPEGEGMTQTGRILGMIATVLSIIGILIPLGLFGFFCCIGILAAANDPNRNRRR